MSGHSKWHNIQARKGKQDAKRSNEFTKLAKLITIAAQKGGDPTMNFSLRIAIDKAKAVSVPKDNIERAIKRGTGEIEGARMEEALYEGFGPGGVAVLVKVVTDNKNRSLSDLKHIFSEAGGSLGSSGSVAWMFGQWGVAEVALESGLGKNEEQQLSLIEAGAEDFKEVEAVVEIKTKVENLQKVLNKLKELGIGVKESGIRWIAKDSVEASSEIQEKLADLFGELEAHDDVEDYYTNAE